MTSRSVQIFLLGICLLLSSVNCLGQETPAKDNTMPSVGELFDVLDIKASAEHWAGEAIEAARRKDHQ